jgi:hypothetical protein
VGARVLICTWLFVISGCASIGRCVAEYTPQIIRAIVIKPMTNLLFMEKWIILSKKFMELNN